MRTLSKLGRQIICERLGIYDENSIFINDVDAFVDRVELLNLSTHVLKWIDIYKKEMDSFESEESYVKFLDESELKLYSIISEMIYFELEEHENAFLDIIQTDFNYRFGLKDNIISMAINNEVSKLDVENMKTDKVYDINIDSDTFEDNNTVCIRLHSNSIVYTALKFLCSNHNLPSDLCTFIEDVTGSKYLASMDDLDIESIDYRLQKKIEKEINIVLFSAISIISPKYINPKSLLGVDRKGLFFLTSPNIPVNTLDKIHNAIKQCEIPGCKDLDISICKFTILENILCMQDDNDTFEVFSDDELDIINITRLYKGETPSKYDRYFQIKGREAQLLNNYT